MIKSALSVRSRLMKLLPAILLIIATAYQSSAQVFQAVRLFTQDAGYIATTTFDIDGNGYKDFIVFKNQQPAAFLVDSTGIAIESTLLADLVTDFPVSSGSGWRKALVADIDGDGKNDLVFQMTNVGLVRTGAFNTATSRYSMVIAAPPSALPVSVYSMATGDFNGDSKIDFLLAWTSIVMLVQQADGSFVNHSLVPGPLTAPQLMVSDLDNDGDADFLVPTGSPSKLKLFRNSGDATFVAQDIASLGITGRPYSAPANGIAVADLDKDGDKDIVVASAAGSWVGWYQNNNGVFSETILRSSSNNTSSGANLTLTDFDEDGDVDIVVGRPHVAITGVAGLSIFENLEGGTFLNERSVFDYGYNYTTPVSLTTAGLSADFNGDGKLDFLMTYGSNWQIFSTRYQFVTPPSWLELLENYLGGGSNDYVIATITNPFKSPMRTSLYYEGTYGNVTGWGYDTDSIYFAGKLSEINFAIHWIYYSGVYYGKQYFDINYTNMTTGRSYSNRINFTLTDPGLLVLPVELLAFSARQQREGIKLNWKTATESSTSHFDLERAENETNIFRKIGEVEAAGNSNSILSYDFLDRQPAVGINRYRLKIVDIDGKSSYSKIATVTTRQTTGLKVYPVPAFSDISVEFGDSVSSIEITDQLGRSIRQIRVPTGVTNMRIAVHELKPGTYYIKTEAGSVKFVKK